MGRKDGGDCAAADKRLFGSNEEEGMKVKASGGVVLRPALQRVVSVRIAA